MRTSMSMPYYLGSALETVYSTAQERDYGFIASNVTHPDILVGQLAGAISVNSDLVLQVKHDTAEYFGHGDAITGLHIVTQLIRSLSNKLSIGVFLNVDHVRPSNESFLEAAIHDASVSSVMIDASDKPFEENIAQTREVVTAIDDAGQDMLVEAELGTIAGTESGVETTEALYTEPNEAVEFVKRTGCDLLAVSLGTEHGVSKGHDLDLKPSLATEIELALEEAGLNIPLVVHGSSGLTRDQVQELLGTGVCKLNTNTRYQYEYARKAAEFYRDNSATILPPDGVVDDRETFFSGADWSPDKAIFNPQVVSQEVRTHIRDVASELFTIAGSDDRSRFS